MTINRMQVMVLYFVLSNLILMIHQKSPKIQDRGTVLKFVCWQRRPVGKLWLSGLVDIQDAVRYRLIFVLIASVVATDLCTSHIFFMV